MIITFVNINETFIKYNEIFNEIVAIESALPPYTIICTLLA